MANKAENFSNQKTVREFLNRCLTGETYLYINTAGLDKEPVYQKVYNVDVIWDGGSYYLSYTMEDGAGTVYVTHLDMVMPIKVE
jgi:hypothetical protein